MQVLFSLPEFAAEFGAGAVDKFVGEANPEDDLRLQLYAICTHSAMLFSLIFGQ